MRELPLYPLDQAELTIPIKELGQTYLYRVRRPVMQDELETERLGQTVKITHPKNKEGQTGIEIRTDQTRALLAYAKRLLKSVKGFALDDNDTCDDFLPINLPLPPTAIKANTDATLMVGDATPLEAIIHNLKPEDMSASRVSHTVFDLLPAHHLRAVAEKVYGGEIKVIEPLDGKVVRCLTGQNLTGLEWLIKDTTVDEDAEDDPNDPYAGIAHRVVFLFKDPTARAMRLWETNALNKINIVGKDNRVTETSFYNLSTVYELAKTCVHSIGGASIGGREIDLQNHPEDWEWVPHRIQKSIVAIFFNYIVNELGN